MTPPAESSPATTERTTLFIPEGEARADFMKTGVIPEPKAESAPAKEPPAAKAEKTAPASEPGDKQERKNTAETRLNDLLDGLREAGLTPAALKTFAKDYQRVQAEPVKPATERTEKPAIDPKAPVRPKPEDFEGKTWAEYEAAKDKYSEDMADYKSRKAIDDYRAQQAQDAQAGELKAKLTEATKRYGESAEATIRTTADTLFQDAKIPAVVKSLVNDSPVLVDALFVLGSKAEDLADFIASARQSPGAAIRKFVLVEKLIQEELAKGSADVQTERGNDGKFKAPEPKTTKAPPPPTEVGGRGAPPADEMETAFHKVSKSGDARSFIEAENAREIRRRKGL